MQSMIFVGGERLSERNQNENRVIFRGRYEFRFEMESKPSTKHRSLVCGVGINDAPFITSMRKDGKLHHHTAYKDWHNMINRCYSGKYPSYHGVVVVDKWHYFMNFHTWWCNNYQQGYALDKDLLVEGTRLTALILVFTSLCG